MVLTATINDNDTSYRNEDRAHVFVYISEPRPLSTLWWWYGF